MCGNREAPERSEEMSARNFVARKPVAKNQIISILSKQLWPHGYLLRATLEFLLEMAGVSFSEYRLFAIFSRAVKRTETLSLLAR